MCTYFDENFLNLVPADHVEGLYGCLDYYRAVDDPFSIELLNRYEGLYPGSAMFTAGSACTGTYRALKLWEAAVNEAGSLNQDDVIAALDHARIVARSGRPRRDGSGPAPRANEHVHRPVRGRHVQGGEEPRSHRPEGMRGRAVLTLIPWNAFDIWRRAAPAQAIGLVPASPFVAPPLDNHRSSTALAYSRKRMDTVKSANSANRSLETQIMPDFSYHTEATIDAAPNVLFDIVSDPSLHIELAGSGELKTVSKKPPGAVEIGTRLLAEESVKLADGSGLDVTSDSVVVICDAPTTFSWIAHPFLPDRLRRVQWWFHFTPEGDGTSAVHEVEIDFGDLQDEMLKGLRDNFEQVRAPVVRAGMDRTLENLRRMAAR